MSLTAERTASLILPTSITSANDWHWCQIARRMRVEEAVGTPVPDDIDYIFIVFTNRSGSNYLSELLATTEFFPLALEILRADAILRAANSMGSWNLSEIFTRLVYLQQFNDYFVTKVSIGQICMLGAYGILDKILGRSRFIMVERMDKIAQTISWAIANQTGRFSSYDIVPETVQPVYDEETLVRDLRGLLLVEAETRKFFVLNRIVPFHVTYENLLADPRQIGTMLLSWLGRPGLACMPDHIGLQRQQTRINHAWAERLLASPLLGMPE